MTTRCALSVILIIYDICANVALSDNVRMVSIIMTDPVRVITPGRDRCLMARYAGIIVFCSLALHFLGSAVE